MAEMLDRDQQVPVPNICYWLSHEMFGSALIYEGVIVCYRMVTDLLLQS